MTPIDPCDDEKVKIARLEEKVKAVQEKNALDLAEIRRRLEELNHAHANAVLDRDKFLPIITHDRFYTEWSTWRDQFNKAVGDRLTIIEFQDRFQEYVKWRDEVNKTLAARSGSVATWGTVLLLTTLAANFLVHYLLK